MTFVERKSQIKGFMNKVVRVSIDRPIGTAHPKHSEIIYKINYGFIEGVIGGDGEELDVYVLGVEQPVKECTVKIIAAVHRQNDVEDKLVGAPQGTSFTKAEIEMAVNFQEQFYKSHVEMA